MTEQVGEDLSLIGNLKWGAKLNRNMNLQLIIKMNCFSATPF